MSPEEAERIRQADRAMMIDIAATEGNNQMGEFARRSLQDERERARGIRESRQEEQSQLEGAINEIQGASDQEQIDQVLASLPSQQEEQIREQMEPGLMDRVTGILGSIPDRFAQAMMGGPLGPEATADRMATGANLDDISGQDIKDFAYDTPPGNLAQQIAVSAPGVGTESQLRRQMERGEISRTTYNEELANALEEANVGADQTTGETVQSVLGSTLGTASLALGGMSAPGTAAARGALGAGRAVRSGRLARGAFGASDDLATTTAMGLPRTAQAAGRIRRGQAARQTGVEAGLGAAFEGGRAAEEGQDLSGIATSAGIGAGIGAGIAGGIGAIGTRVANKAGVRAERAASEATRQAVNQASPRGSTLEEVMGELDQPRPIDMGGRTSPGQTSGVRTGSRPANEFTQKQQRLQQITDDIAEIDRQITDEAVGAVPESPAGVSRGQRARRLTQRRNQLKQEKAQLEDDLVNADPGVGITREEAVRDLYRTSDMSRAEAQDVVDNAQPTTMRGSEEIYTDESLHQSADELGQPIQTATDPPVEDAPTGVTEEAGEPTAESLATKREKVEEQVGLENMPTFEELAVSEPAKSTWYSRGVKKIADALKIPGQKVEQAGQRAAERGFRSNSRIANGLAKGMDGLLSESTISDDTMEVLRRKWGDEAYGDQLARRIQQTAVETMGEMDDDALRESFKRIHSVMDPDLYQRAGRESITKADLTEGEQQSMEFLQSVSDYMNDLNYHNGFITREQWSANKGGKYMARGYDVDFSPEVKKYLKGMGVKMDESLYTGRKALEEIDDETIEKMIEDPALLLSQRFQQTMTNDARARLASSISQDSSVASKSEIQGWHKMSDHKSHGDLAGMYVRPDVANMINGIQYQSQFGEAVSTVINAYDRNPLRRGRKKLETILNPMTRMTNRFGNKFGFAVFDGIDPLSHTKLMTEASQQMDNDGRQYLEASRLGLLGSDNALPFLQKNAERMKATVRESGMSKKRIKQAIKSIDDAMVHSYTGVDDKTKLAAYIHHTRRGYTPQEAAQRVARHYQNYRTISWAWDASSKTPFLGGAFNRFLGDFIRVSKNNTLDNPLRPLALLGAFRTLQVGMSELSGESREDRRTREGRPYQNRIPFTDIPITVQTPWGELDASRVMGATHLALPESEQVFQGEGALSNAANTAMTFSPFTVPVQRDSDTGDLEPNTRALLGGEDILAQSVVEQLLDENFRGESISESEEGRLNQFITSSAGGLVNALRNVYRSSQGEQTVYGSSPESAKESLSGLTAFNLEDFGPEEAQEQRETSQFFEADAELSQLVHDFDSRRKRISSRASELAREGRRSRAEGMLEELNESIESEIERLQERHGEDNLDWRKLERLRNMQYSTSDNAMEMRAE